MARARRSRAIPIALASAVVLALAGPASADRLQVKVEGVTDELRANVLGMMAIDNASGDLTETQIRHLHARAPEEIRQALVPFGHYRALVRDALEVAGNTWTARYEIVPGPAVKLDTVDVRVTGAGADDPGFARLVARYPLKVGDPLLHPRYLAGKQSFIDQASRGGYLDAQFDVARAIVHLERYAATIHLHYDTGPRFLFGEVRFEQDILDPDLLDRYVHVRPGEPFDYSRLLRLQEALLASPYFRGAEIVPRRDLAEDLRVPIEIRLIANEPRHLTGGLGFGTDEGLSARAGLDLRRLNRHGHRAGIEGTFSQIERGVTGRYEIPWSDPRTDALTFGLGWAVERPATSRSRRLLAGASLRRQLGSWTRTLALDFQHDRFRVGEQSRASRFLTPMMGWFFLRADSRIFTSTGLRVDLDSRGAAESILSDASFLRVASRAKWIETPWNRTRAILRGEVGTTWTGDFAALSPSLRFFAGGAQTVRGFEYQGVGPRDSTGAVTGGPHLLVGSIELDHRLLDRWLVAAFYDMGSALFRRGDPVEDAAGVGLRWISPVGPVRLDAAMPLHEPGRRVRFHLTLGPDL